MVAAVLIYVYRCKLFPNLCVEDPNKNNEPVPSGSPTTTWIPETIPYNVGMFGPKIKALQKAVGIPDDGKFGNQTKATIMAKGYVVPLSDSDYNKIVKPSSSTNQAPCPGKTIDACQSYWIKAKYNGTPLRFISDNKIYKTLNAGEDIGRIGEALPSGFHKITGRTGSAALFELKLADSWIKTILGI